MIHQTEWTQTPPGRGLYRITRQVEEAVARSGVLTGLCTLFIHHTSASLIISENADPTVLDDLNDFLERLVPDGDPRYAHSLEGPDDMPAHIRSVLTQTSVSIPVMNGRLALGTWQGIYLWEHRTSAHRRRISVTICG